MARRARGRVLWTSADLRQSGEQPGRWVGPPERNATRQRCRSAPVGGLRVNDASSTPTGVGTPEPEALEEGQCPDDVGAWNGAGAGVRTCTCDRDGERSCSTE